LLGCRLVLAWKLLDDFDRLIDAMWGPRRFKKMSMPPKPAPGARTA